MKIILLLLVLGCLLLLYLVIENKFLKVTNYNLPYKSLPEEFEGMKAVCITDLHCNQYGKKNGKLLTAIIRCNPDMVLIAGDMMIARKPKKAEIALDFLKELSNLYPVYYSPGNHETKWQNAPSDSTSMTYQEYIDALRENGICYLDNESITIRKRAAELVITGLNLPISYYNKGGSIKSITPEILKDMIGDISQNEFQILLAHMPNHFDTYIASGADFILSGHVHGGIMRLPFLGGVISPQYEIFPKYDAGLFRKEGAFMLLSRGLGTHTIPVRVFNRPELAVVTFTKNKES